MSSIKKIDLSIVNSIEELASSLKGMGELRVSKGTNAAGNKVTFLRERTNWEAVKDFFTLDAKVRARSAHEAHAAIQSVLKDKVNAGQLLQNIQDRINHTGSFSGRSIARDLSQENLSETGKVRALQGGNVVAESAGGRMHIMHKSPLEIQSKFTIVRASSVPETLQKLIPAGKAESIYQFTQPKGIAASELIIFKDATNLEDDMQWNKELRNFSKNLNEALLFLATEGGNVVIEVSPAMFGRNKNAMSFSREREYMSTVIKAAKQSLEFAKKCNKEMAVTFAGEDQQFLALFKSQYEADRLGLNKARKNELSDQDDLSESDDDDEDARLAFVNEIKAGLAKANEILLRYPSVEPSDKNQSSQAHEKKN